MSAAVDPWLPLGANPRPPPRRNHDDRGTRGKPIKLRSNHFPVTIKNQNLTLHHYDVAFQDWNSKPVRLPKDKQFAIFNLVKTKYPNIFRPNMIVGFDREKSAYSINKIPELAKGKLTFDIEYAEDPGVRPSKFKVTMEMVNQADLSEIIRALDPRYKNEEFPSTLLQMVEVLFRHCRNEHYSQVGRNMFFPYEQHNEFRRPFGIGHGKEGILGFFSSLRPARWKNTGRLLLNLDVAHAAFYKPQPLMDFIKETYNVGDRDFDSTLRPDIARAITKELKLIKLQINYSGIKRSYKLQQVLKFGPRKQTFPLKDDRTGKETQCTVEKYIRDRYKKQCRFPFLNCVQVGDPKKNVYIPIEFCEIAKKQKVRRKLDDMETRQFITSTALPPRERLNQIIDIRRKIKDIEQPVINNIQFQIDDMPLSIMGRVLQPPELEMKNTKFRPDKGVWDIQRKSFFNGAEFVDWAVVNYDQRSNKNTIENFLNMLMKMGKEKGMRVGDPVDLLNIRHYDPSKDFKQLLTKHPNLKLIICIIYPSSDLYGKIKKAGDTECGIITQCVKAINVNKCQGSTVSNILLKINTKLGGVNNIIEPRTLSESGLFSEPIMVMGADVNHPAPNNTVTPSLAAVVASYDKNASYYNVEIRHQKHRVEMIQDLQQITRQLLVDFFKKSRAKPKRIIMFRDGVSESQFLEVLSFELKKMRDACEALEKGYHPAITFICVQKRHHTRLFCDEKDGVGKSKNVPPGTTVDTDITHPTERDFYLCSHQGIKGTSRPTHYHVLWDDSDLTMDNLQTLTYLLCHTYSRCTRSVSIPTPAYYAHLAAFRAKVHLESNFDMDDSSSLSSSAENLIPDADLANSIRINKTRITKGLYFV